MGDHPAGVAPLRRGPARHPPRGLQGEVGAGRVLHMLRGGGMGGYYIEVHRPQ